MLHHATAQTPTPPKRGAGKRRARIANALIAVGAVFLGAALSTAPAQAVPVEAIDPGTITITHTTGGSEVVLYDELRVSADWAAPPNAVAGDTFRLVLPTEFNVNGGTFPLEVRGGGDAGICTVTPKDGETRAYIDCALSDYITGKDDVGGLLWFKVQAVTVTENTQVEFGVGAGNVMIPLPGSGGIVPRPDPMPTDVYKGGFVVTGHESVIAWKVVAPGNRVNAAGDLVIRDVYSNDLELIEGSTDFPLLVHSMARTQAAWDLNEWDDITDARVESFPDTHELVVTIPGPIDPEKIYEVFYHTQIVVPYFPGDAFSNTASFNGVDRSASVTITETGGGTGSGVPRGEIEIRKVTEGAVEPDLQYLVDASFTRFGLAETRELPLAAGGDAQRLNNLPAGTVVTLTEELPALQAGEWNAPRYTGAGVVDHGDGTATITVLAEQTIEVTLTNSLAVPETPTGGFTLTKEVTGPGSELVPATTQFRVLYTATGPEIDRNGDFTLTPNGTVGLGDLPAGTEVTLTEIFAVPLDVADADARTIAFGTPGFSVSGGAPSETASFVIRADETVAVVLTNPTRVTNVPGTVTPPTANPGGTGAPAGLASTGGPGSLVPALTGGVLVALGLATALPRLRRARTRA